MSDKARANAKARKQRYAGLAAHIGRETEIKALGQSWRLSRWTRAVWADFLDWARTKIPDPIEVAQRNLDKWPVEIQHQIAAKAQEAAQTYLSMGSPQINALLSSPEGASYLLYLLLRANHRDVTEDIAFDIMTAVGEAELNGAFSAAQGESPQRGNPSAPAA